MSPSESGIPSLVRNERAIRSFEVTRLTHYEIGYNNPILFLESARCSYWLELTEPTAWIGLFCSNKSSASPISFDYKHSSWSCISEIDHNKERNFGRRFHDVIVSVDSRRSKD